MSLSGQLPKVEKMTASEQVQIREIPERLVDAWNSEDMDAFVSLFTADAAYVTGAGVLFKGIPAIHDGLSSQKESGGGSDPVAITDVSVNLVRSDVAVVHSTWEMPGERLEARKGIFTLVVTRDHEGWRIVALQNTDRVESPSVREPQTS